MEVVVDRCAGIDIGKVDVKVCVRAPGGRAGTRRGEVRTFGTTTRELLRLLDWLTEERVTLVGMESTGVYWKPVYYLLEEHMECWLINAQHIKKVPGRKTDVTDAMWIAELVEHGLVRPSFVPPPPIRRLRDLTRYRAALMHERTREVQRLHDVLEDAGIKLSCVASDILGVSGRDMIEALIAGERDPHVLAELARSRMRTKLPALKESLTGRFTDHHGLMCRLMLDRIDALDGTVAELGAQIDREMTPFQDAVTLLSSIPGVGTRVAEVLIAEIGADMSRFPTPEQLTSWAGMCPGNNESAGKHFSGRTRKGDTWLRGALGEAAAAAARSKGTYLGERFHRLARRRGRRRALVATARLILQSTWYVLTHHVPYRDLGPDYHRSRIRDPHRHDQRMIKELVSRGYRVTPAHAA